MTPENSYPVSYQLQSINARNTYYDKGFTLAEPDIQDAAQKMRHVYDNQEEAQSKGLRASRDIIESYSVKSVAEEVAQRLREIQSILNLSKNEATSVSHAQRLRNDLGTLEFNYRIDRYWSTRQEPNLLKRLTPERVLRRILKPMLDQLASYHQANYRVINHLLTEIDDLKKQSKINDEK